MSRRSSAGGDLAGYIPSKDYITLPPAAALKSMESYYAPTLHELGHRSGHETRLKRELSTRFGSESYAAEELVAELTSAFLCAQLGVQGELRHSGYIDHWIKLLKSDPRAIFTAASKASQTANYLRSLSEARNEVLVLDNKRYLWRNILKLPREQRMAARNAQPALFEVRDDERPKTQHTASSRYEEPTLFE